MPDFDTKTPPERRNRPLRLRMVLLANRLRGRLIASKPHILSIANRLYSLLITNRLRTLLIGGAILWFVVTAPVGLFIYASSERDGGVPGPGYYDLDYVSCDSYILTKTGDCVEPYMGEGVVNCKAEERWQVDEFTTPCS